MNSKLTKIFNWLKERNDRAIIPIGGLTLYLEAYWVSKLDNKFKIEYRVDELDVNGNLEYSKFYIDEILKFIDKKEAEEYLKNGWRKGMLKRKKVLK